MLEWGQVEGTDRTTPTPSTKTHVLAPPLSDGVQWLVRKFGFCRYRLRYCRSCSVKLPSEMPVLNRALAAKDEGHEEDSPALV
jgi:hypothetical protein